MGWRLVKKVDLCVTKALAERVAEMHSLPQDRVWKPKIARMLERAIGDNTFRPPQWAVCHCNENGKTYRVNGKHSSTVLALANGSFPKGLKCSLEHYEADTLFDVASLFNTFDARESARLAGDINRSFACTNDALGVIKASIRDLLVSGIASAQYECNYFHIDPRIRGQEILKHVEFCVWFDGLMSHKDNATTVRHLRRSPVVGAMFMTYGKSKRHCDEFWCLVRDGSGENPKSPDRSLRDFLLSASLSGVGHNRSSGVCAREMLVKCIHAWNAWRRGDETDMKYYPKSPIPPVK